MANGSSRDRTVERMEGDRLGFRRTFFIPRGCLCRWLSVIDFVSFRSLTSGSYEANQVQRSRGNCLHPQCSCGDSRPRLSGRAELGNLYPSSQTPCHSEPLAAAKRRERVEEPAFVFFRGKAQFGPEESSVQADAPLAQNGGIIDCDRKSPKADRHATYDGYLLQLRRDSWCTATNNGGISG